MADAPAQAPGRGAGCARAACACVCALSLASSSPRVLQIVRAMESEGSASGAVSRPVLLEGCVPLELGAEALDAVAEANRALRLAAA
jgi:hypothetical protein